MQQQLTETYRPRRLADFVGIDRIVKILQHLAKNPRESAFLALGGSGLGKTTIFKALAEEMQAELIEIPSGACDLETVEELCRRCWYVPFAASGWRVVVCNEADKMSAKAQLCFLSKLDSSDAPPRTVWAFTCNETTLLEDRFISRCRKIEWPTPASMQSAAVELLRKVWISEGHSLKHAPEFTELFISSGCNIRTALNNLEMEMIAPSEDEVEEIADYSALSQVYSLGAEKLEPSEVREICAVLGITTVVDCLQKHFKRRVDHQRAVESAGMKFIQRPGLVTFPPDAKDINWLKKITSEQRVMLLGGPEAPGDCRRHVQIATALLKKGVDCVHVFQDVLVKASDLQYAIDNRVDEVVIPFERKAA